MPQVPLLPGVSDDRCVPKVRVESRRVMTRARREAVVRELAQAALIIAIDLLFLQYPSTHIPFLTRNQSMAVILAFHALIGAQVLIARVLPLWTARRIASSWSASEQRRTSLR